VIDDMVRLLAASAQVSTLGHRDAPGVAGTLTKRSASPPSVG
jgi:hypothetical protein